MQEKSGLIQSTACLVEAYAENRKVAGSFTDEVIGFFNWSNPVSCTVAMGST
jgi:hypothetical protein